MSINAVLSELQCPICIDILQAPVRILSCGHNFCGKCIKRQLSQDIDSCPKCRKQIDCYEEESFIRNYSVERVLELIPQERTASAYNRPVTKLSRYTIREIQEIVEHLRERKKFQSALDFLQILVDQMDGLDQLRQSVATMRCLFALGRIKEAKEICHQKIIHLINSITFDQSVKESYPILDDDLLGMLQDCKDRREFADAQIPLSHALIRVITTYYKDDSETHLRKLSNFGCAVKSFTAGGRQYNAKKIDLMNAILEEMQKIDEVNLRKKFIEVATFLCHISDALRSVRKYSQSSVTCMQAITLIRTTNGKTSEQKVLGDCYYSLGVTYRKQLFGAAKARNAFEKAIEIYKSSCDLSKETKQVNINNAYHELDEMEFYRRRNFALLPLSFIFTAFLLLIAYILIFSTRVEHNNTPDHYFP